MLHKRNMMLKDNMSQAKEITQFVDIYIQVEALTGQLSQLATDKGALERTLTAAQSRVEQAENSVRQFHEAQVRSAQPPSRTDLSHRPRSLP